MAEKVTALHLQDMHWVRGQEKREKKALISLNSPARGRTQRHTERVVCALRELGSVSRA